MKNTPIYLLNALAYYFGHRVQLPQIKQPKRKKIYATLNKTQEIERRKLQIKKGMLKIN